MCCCGAITGLESIVNILLLSIDVIDWILSLDVLSLSIASLLLVDTEDGIIKLCYRD